MEHNAAHHRLAVKYQVVPLAS